MSVGEEERRMRGKEREEDECWGGGEEDEWWGEGG